LVRTCATDDAGEKRVAAHAVRSWSKSWSVQEAIVHVWT